MRESEVLDILSSLQDSRFIVPYCRWAYQRSETPHIFNLTTALSVLATVGSADMGIQTPPALGTWWTILVGESGESRKTTAITNGMRILSQVCPERRISSAHSMQGLVEAVYEVPVGLIAYPEFGEFLSSSAKPGAMRDVRTKLLEIWDGNRITRRLSKKRKKDGEQEEHLMVIERPRVSVIAGVAPSLLESYTDREDWTGGFISRFAVFYGERERSYPIPESAAHLEGAAVEGLALCAQHALAEGGYECAGYEKPARSLLVDWTVDLDNEYKANTDHPWTRGLAARAQGVALRSAVLRAFDRGAIHQGWQLAEADVLFGAMLASEALTSAVMISQTRLGSPWARARQAVLDVIGDKKCTESKILRQIQPKMSRRQVAEILETLIAERTIKQVGAHGTDPLYRLTDSDV